MSVTIDCDSMGLPYYAPLVKEEITYSVDKMKLKLELTEEFALMLLDDPFCMQRMTQKLKYKERHKYDNTDILIYNGKFAGKEGHVQVKIRLQLHSCHYCEVVCNPNKSFRNPDCLSDINVLLQNCSSFYLDSMDIAMDIPVHANFLRVQKDKRIMERLCRKLGIETIYLGKRGKNGNVRIYDKQEECHLPFALTRAEITVGNPLDCDFRKQIINALPIIYHVSETISDNEKTISQSFSSTDTVLILALRQCPDKCNLVRMLEAKKVKKLKPYVLAGNEQIKFDVDTIVEVALHIMQLFEREDGVISWNRYIVKNSDDE